MGRFEEWLSVVVTDTMGNLARSKCAELCERLAKYTYQLFETRWPRSEARLLLNGISDRFLSTRELLSGPWRVLRNWEKLEPDQHRSPLPWVWLRALTVAAVSWGWERLALCFSLSFFCLLRSTEMSGLRRKDCMLPRKHGMGEFMLLCIREPKSRWAAGAQQYPRIDDLPAHRWLVQELEKLGREEWMWPGSPATIARRFAHLCAAMLGSSHIVLLSGLRTGGATHCFMSWREDLPLLCWRGRWRDQRMLGTYVQELSAGLTRMRLLAADLARVEILSALYEEVITTY